MLVNASYFATHVSVPLLTTAKVLTLC